MPRNGSEPPFAAEKPGLRAAFLEADDGPFTRIKMCGMRREADVDAAVDLAVDAVGFVLWDGSPRHATPSTTAALVRRLPPSVTPVAVLVNPTSAAIAQAVDELGCRIVQVHGVIEGAGVTSGTHRLVRAVALGQADGTVVPDVEAGVDVLLDAHDPLRHGGTGRTVDWTRAALVARRRRTILAGGLTASNVAEAVRSVRPYGVDVASGVEAEPGVKDRAAMRAFVAAVRSVT
ncbi:MAG: phosphoribosylanthranilate isomerase [Acidobacteria bacterium]|nr:phosphoribosylanthranilate isomerase [Acidobacteriota bacterium]